MDFDLLVMETLYTFSLNSTQETFLSFELFFDGLHRI
jgi:hypothetical protein